MDFGHQNSLNDEILNPCTIHPNNKYKLIWDLYICLLLLFECSYNPIIIAFDFNMAPWLQTFTTIIDISFGIDIILTFRQAYYNENNKLVQDPRVLAVNYLFGWLLIDLLAIINLQWFMSGEDTANNYNNLARALKIGKIAKLIKMTRLIRFLKIIKERNKLLKYLHNILHIDAALERLFFFLLVFIIFGHILSCLWLTLAFYHYDRDSGEWTTDLNWILAKDYEDMTET